MTHLHIFDMDGTLLTGTTANLEIARHLGTLPELHDLEARFAAGTLDTRGLSAEIHRLWRWLGGLHENGRPDYATPPP